jgi:hypothetical protein
MSETSEVQDAGKFVFNIRAQSRLAGLAEKPAGNSALGQ